MKHYSNAEVTLSLQGASIPWGKNQADGIFQAANIKELAASMLSVLDVKILSLLILQLVYFSTT